MTTGPARYFNREGSWLQFNARVLAEAENRRNPLLERIKFLAIFESNLDEFFMVRVSGLIEQEEAGIAEPSPDGQTAKEQLAMIAGIAPSLRLQANEILKQKLLPPLAKQGIRLMDWEDLTPLEQEQLASHFLAEIFPVCTPLMLEPTTTFPFISNRSLNLAVELKDGDELKLGRVKIPTVVRRTVAVPGRRNCFLLLETLVTSQLHRLFPGVEVLGSHLFRVIRDADVEIRELEASDLIEAVEKSLRLRRMGDPVLLEVQPGLGENWLAVLRRGLQLDPQDVVVVDGPLGLDFLWELSAIDKPALKFPPLMPAMHPQLATTEGIFEAIRHGEFLLHHPYDSFQPVEDFSGSVAKDPRSLGVKQTLYRVGAKSPIVEALLAGAEQGRQVAVMVELKARFDESNNLTWARALERAGVHVTYGFQDMKTHCKLCLVVRREPDGIRTYAHIGTGNYNPATARVYTDIGIFTDDPAICADITELFNYLTGWSKQTQFRKLLVAPLTLRDGIIERIEREAEHCRRTGAGRIMFKLNALVDPEVIDALYEASLAGVKIDLVVRGACCLRPGVKGLSDNIRVVSVVGRFLEHSRVYYFGNAGKPEAFIGSADMMRRNLDRRIEVLAPVEQPSLIEYLREWVVEPALKDNVQAWQLSSAGVYRRLKPRRGEPVYDSQALCLRHPASPLVPHLPPG